MNTQESILFTIEWLAHGQVNLKRIKDIESLNAWIYEDYNKFKESKYYKQNTNDVQCMKEWLRCTYL